MCLGPHVLGGQLLGQGLSEMVHASEQAPDLVLVRHNQEFSSFCSMFRDDGKTVLSEDSIEVGGLKTGFATLVGHRTGQREGFGMRWRHGKECGNEGAFERVVLLHRCNGF